MISLSHLMIAVDQNNTAVRDLFKYLPERNKREPVPEKTWGDFLEDMVQTVIDSLPCGREKLHRD